VKRLLFIQPPLRCARRLAVIRCWKAQVSTVRERLHVHSNPVYYDSMRCLELEVHSSKLDRCEVNSSDLTYYCQSTIESQIQFCGERRGTTPFQFLGRPAYQSNPTAACSAKTKTKPLMEDDLMIISCRAAASSRPRTDGRWHSYTPAGHSRAEEEPPP
jgi:hypothetical protein